MKQAQLIVFEPDGRLAEWLRPVADSQRWRLREIRQEESVLATLHEALGVVVLRLGRDVASELRLLERISWFYPETAVVAVLEGEPALIGLAWELGAAFVLPQAQAAEQLVPIVVGLMSPEGPQ